LASIRSRLTRRTTDLRPGVPVKLETGAAALYEPGAVACGRLQVTTLRPLLDARHFVPRQLTYPAHFLVEAQSEYGGQPWAEVLVFTKTAAGRAWLVSEDSGFGPPPGQPASLGRPTTTFDGYVLTPYPEQHTAATTIARRCRRSTATGCRSDRLRRLGGPPTWLSVVFFALLIAPGPLFDLLAEHRRVGAPESTFREVSQVVLASLVFSGLGFLVGWRCPGDRACVDARRQKAPD
jgi:hypothetical protein